MASLLAERCQWIELSGASARPSVARMHSVALITRVFAGHQDAMEHAMSGLSKADRATLTDLLKRLGTTAEARLIQEDGVTS